MAELTRTHRYERFAPDLGDNRELEQPFYLEVTSGLSFEALDAFRQRLVELQDLKGGDLTQAVDAILHVLQDCVRMGREPLLVGGKPVASLREYIELIAGITGGANVTELFSAVIEANSVSGQRALFSKRLSGGWATTAHPRNGTQRAGR